MTSPAAAGTGSSDARGHRPWLRAVFALFLLAAATAFIALAAWQWQRMGWKSALIARVEARLQAAPVPPMAPAQWPTLSAQAHEYTRVLLRGSYLDVPAVRVQAVTAQGAGWWVLSPLRVADDGQLVLVNRGFVPAEVRQVPPPTGEVEVTGLLRMDEPGGAFLRDNAPAQGRWYSRDVRAIAAAQGLDAERVAPYFIDAWREVASASNAPAATTAPLPGLTVVRFRDQHLGYALTWAAMAAMALGGAALLYLPGRKLRQHRVHRRPSSHSPSTDAGSRSRP